MPVDAFARLSAKEVALDAARPLPAGVVARLREALDVEWTYHWPKVKGGDIMSASPFRAHVIGGAWIPGI